MGLSARDPVAVFDLLAAADRRGRLIGRHNDRYGTRNSVLSGAALRLLVASLMRPCPSSWLSLLIGTTILGLGMTLQLAGIQAEIGVFRHDRHRISMTQA